MKKLVLILSFLSSVCLFAQNKITYLELAKIHKVKQGEGNTKALEYITELKKQQPAKDSLYAFMLTQSYEINRSEYNFEAALADLEEVLQVMPGEEENILTSMASLANYSDKTDTKIAFERKIIAKYPHNEIVYNNLANTYNYQNNYTEALKVLESNPEKPGFYGEGYQYARAYFGLKKYDKAKEHIERYLNYQNTDESIDIGEGPAGDCLAHKLAAEIYNALGHTSKSCASITRADELEKAHKEIENLEALPEKIKSLPLGKQRIAELKEIQTLKEEYCK